MTMPETIPQPGPGEWDCEAYGPGGREVGALCFFGGAGQRHCATAAECHLLMTGERQRVYDRIRDLAAAGDPVGVDLAETFTSPDELLGGGQ